MNPEREVILDLFRKRGLQAGGLYSLPEFLHDIDFDGDPKQSEAKRSAFRDLVQEGAIIEMNAALEPRHPGPRITWKSKTSEAKLVTQPKYEKSHCFDMFFNIFF